ncbi:PIN domain-containing protein [Algoriphagus terrigena]|uniref:PIN domain-containing protein n=1 Tax=Algoriphagus terrigena TaxID=344884 RepID=UPI0012FC830B
MTRARILVDSSVWIDFFRTSKSTSLNLYLEEDLVSINDIILSELVPKLLLERKTEIVEGLFSLEKFPLNIDWDLIRYYQVLNLKNGINKVGIPDLIILQQVIEEKLTLFSFDKNFRLMQNFLKFDLIQ